MTGEKGVPGIAGPRVSKKLLFKVLFRKTIINSSRASRCFISSILIKPSKSDICVAMTICYTETELQRMLNKNKIRLYMYIYTTKI